MNQPNHKEKIAVIGMGALLPGSGTIEQFWENLTGNRDLTSQAQAADFSAPPDVFFHDEKGKLDKCYYLRGGFIRDFIFDPAGYRLDPAFLERQDVLFKWSLYVAREALRDSGYWNSEQLARCGAVVGNLSFPTRYSRQLFAPLYADLAREVMQTLLEAPVEVPASQARYPVDPGRTLLSNAPSALIAQAAGLRGPHYSLDAACASSLYAVKLACDELHTGRADLMLAGAVSGADALFIHTGFSYFHAYPRQEERSAPMDRHSRGLTSSEGAGMLVLKRLSDARRDGDQVYAVIDAVGLSNDGKGKFLLSPNPRGQRLAFERAYAQSGLTPDAIDYLECHATGTPLGDLTEFNSIADFFAGSGQPPLIGTVKSNMGHLLTAAGMAGMIKVILAMRRRLLPATIGVADPMQSADGRIGAAQIVRENRPWPARGAVPRAGINAFGFGGTNAHMILSAPTDEAAPAVAPLDVTGRAMAIVGMDVHFGDCETLEQYYLSLVQGRQHFRALPAGRWKGMETLPAAAGLPDTRELRGAWIEEFELDLLRFKIQPKEAERLTPQQTLMLKVADRALHDAGFDALQGAGANVAVLIAMESELAIHHRIGRSDLSWQVDQALRQAGLALEEEQQATLTGLLQQAVFPAFDDHSPSEHTGFIGNIIASRIASLMDFTGPAFTVSSNENAVYKALEVARNLLAMKEVDAVVLGAVDLNGSLESVLSRHAVHPLHRGGATMGWNQSANGWLIGEGAAAIVLKRADDAGADRVYARIDALAITQSEHTDPRGQAGAAAVEAAARQALTDRRLTAADIGLLEASASGIADEDAAEIAGLTNAYRHAGAALTCALGSSKAHIGHTGSAAGLAAIVRASLALYYRFLPGVPAWEGPARAEAFAGTPFYVPTESRPWIPERGQDTLRAAVSGLAADGASAHLLLSEGDHPDPALAGPFLRQGGERLFPLRAADAGDMLRQLGEMEAALHDQSFTALSDRYCESYAPDAAGRTAVLVAASGAGLRREITFFRDRLAEAWAAGKPLMTPTGSYFTPAPLGPRGKLALVYPGSGSAYPGMGAALFQAFPGLYDAVRSRVNHLSSAFFSADLYPRRLFAPDEAARREEERRLLVSALPMMAVGCTFSVVYTQLLERYLGVRADSAMGYSMGETSAMWYGQGIWDPHHTEEKFLAAPLFREKVGGDMTVLAGLWGLPLDEVRRRWTTRLLSLPEGRPGYASLAEWFRREAAPAVDRVYLTFINTDTEIVLSGDGEAIDRLARQYGLTTIGLSMNNVVHHDFCRQVSGELAAMHHLPVEYSPDKTYYSGVSFAPLTIEPETLARNAVEVCCREVDWPRLVRQMAADGHRLFVEVGANATCSRWISEILGEEDYLAIPSDRKGAGVLRNLCGLAARLLAHGVALDLRPFYEPASSRADRPRVLNKTLPTGGQRYEDIALTAQHRTRFRNAAVVSRPLPVLAGASVREPATAALAGAGRDIFSQSHFINHTHDMVIENKPAVKKAENGLSLQDYGDPNYLKGKTVIWDEQDLLTFATGKISDVFGQEFAVIDTYRRRVMLPMPPYLLVSRVTRLEARVNEYKPSLITTEYDIPYGAFYSTDGQITWAVAVESGQCDLLLISYLGIDFENKGDYVYRLLDCTMTFLDDLPFEGQTLRYDIRINNYTRSGNNLLFFFSYECFVEDRMVLKMDGGCAGFFSDEELAQGQGVVFKPQELAERRSRPRQYFTPLLSCEKTRFEREDLLALTRGDLVACFGEHYHTQGRNPSLRLPPEGILMLDRITRVDLQGGSTGLGFIEAEKDLHPDDWYFPCHFRDDEVLAGSLQAEGGGQLLRFFMLLLGMQRLTRDARFQAVLDLPQKVRCRKEVPAREGKLYYRMDVKEIGLVPEPYVVADLEILYDGLIAVFFENLGLRLQEKDNPHYLKDPANRREGIYVRPVDKPVLLDEYHVTQFALGNVYKCFGEEYRIFEGRQLSRQPNTDLQYISRVLEVTGQRHTFDNSPASVTEYDVPADAWFYTQNAAPVTPYAVLMEIALQPCGFLGAYLGSTLAFPDKDLFLRNLDGDGELLREVDLRGRTVTNRSVLVSHATLGGTIIQRYTFELSVDGEVFYRGSSSFGFFTREDLSSQAGLDRGQHLPPWHQQAGAEATAGGLSFKLDSLFGRMKLFRSAQAVSPQLHLAGGQLNLLDTVRVIPGGGKYGQGYVFATKFVKPYDWFFTCHFYQDPVMPGSLGVEAILQAIRTFALQQGLGGDLRGAAFRQLAGHRTVWKYRGQIRREDREMNLEAHIKEVRREAGRIILIADASLWKGTLRIYEVTDLAVVIGA